MRKYILIVDNKIVGTFGVYACAQIFAMGYQKYTIDVIDMD